MTRVWAMTRHTFAEGMRMRIVLVFLLVLLFVVLRLPFAVKGDETLSGRLQNFLSYSLTAMSVLLGLATIFFSCGTLGHEFRTRTLHLLVTKPVARFEVLLGKWFGVNVLNLLVLTLGGLAIYGLALFIRNQPVEFERDRIKLDQVVWTARESAVPDSPDALAIATEEIERRLESGEPITNPQDAISSRAKEITSEWLRIEPQHYTIYTFSGLTPPGSDEVVYQVRFKARAMPFPADELVPIQWGIRDPDTGRLLESKYTAERQGEIHEFLVRATRVVQGGTAELVVMNPSGPLEAYPLTIFFEGDAGLQLLYEVGTFEWNYVKTILLIWFRLAFLSAVALFFATFVSFPVGCFCCLSIYLFCVGAPFWLEAVATPLGSSDSWLHVMFGQPLVMLMQLLLPDFFALDGIDKLIDGFAVSAAVLRDAALRTLAYGAFLLLVPGWLIFRSREVAQVIV